MSANEKHSGERVAGITVQMRFVPLKTDSEPNEETATISVRVDDAKKGTPDNTQELKLPIILKLESEGETFIQNKIKLRYEVFL